jgi:hypothetical protein
MVGMLDKNPMSTIEKMKEDPSGNKIFSFDILRAQS